MKKIQLYVDEKKDEIVYKLLERLENESKGTRGYIQDQLKERLKAFEMLCRRVGSDDPLEVVLKYVENSSNNPTNVPQFVEDKQEGNSAEELPVIPAGDATKPNDTALKFVKAAENNFDFS